MSRGKRGSLEDCEHRQVFPCTKFLPPVGRFSTDLEYCGELFRETRRWSTVLVAGCSTTPEQDFATAGLPTARGGGRLTCSVLTQPQLPCWLVGRPYPIALIQEYRLPPVPDVLYRTTLPGGSEKVNELATNGLINRRREVSYNRPSDPTVVTAESSRGYGLLATNFGVSSLKAE